MGFKCPFCGDYETFESSFTSHVRWKHNWTIGGDVNRFKQPSYGYGAEQAWQRAAAAEQRAKNGGYSSGYDSGYSSSRRNNDLMDSVVDVGIGIGIGLLADSIFGGGSSDSGFGSSDSWSGGGGESGGGGASGDW